MNSSTHNRGAALIVALAVLTVLFAIGITFFTVGRLEVKVSVNVENTVRADLLCDAGISIGMSVLNQDRVDHPSYTSSDHAWASFFNGSWIAGKAWAFRDRVPWIRYLPGLGDKVFADVHRYAIPQIQFEDLLNQAPEIQFGPGLLYVPREQGQTDPFDAFDSKANQFLIKPRMYVGDPNNPEWAKWEFPVQQIDRWADVDNDDDGLRDSMWIPIPGDPPFRADGIDNDLDGQIDESGEDPFDGIDEDPNDGIDNDGDGLVDEDPFDGIDNDGDAIDNDGDGLVNEDESGEVPNDGIDNDGDGRIDEKDSADASEAMVFVYYGGDDGLDNDGDGQIDEGDEQFELDGTTPKRFLTIPLHTIRVPVDLDLDGVLDVDDDGILETSQLLWNLNYGPGGRYFPEVDCVDNDYSMIINDFDVVAYRLGTTFQEAPRKYHRIDNYYLGGPPIVNGVPVEIWCTGEPVSELFGRIAVLIRDEASKVNINVANAYSYDENPGDPTRPMQRALSDGVGPHEYDLRVLPSIGLRKANSIFSWRMGAPDGDGFWAPTDNPEDVPDLVPPSAAIPPEEVLEYPGYDISVPGLGRADDNANAFWLAMNGIDDDGDGRVDEGINPAHINYLGCFEGIDEPQEYQLAHLYPNEINAMGDARFRTGGHIQAVSGIAEGTFENLRLFTTIHSVERMLPQEIDEGDAPPRIDFNYATPTQIVAMLQRGGGYDPAQWPWPASPADPEFIADPEALAAKRFARGLRSAQLNVVVPGGPTSMGVFGGLAYPGHAAGDVSLSVDGELRAMQIAVNMVDNRDADHARSELSNLDFEKAEDPTPLWVDKWEDDWWTVEAGDSRPITYKVSGVESIRINEIMVRPVRRIEAEMDPTDPTDQFNPNLFSYKSDTDDIVADFDMVGSGLPPDLGLGVSDWMRNDVRTGFHRSIGKDSYVSTTYKNLSNRHRDAPHQVTPDVAQFSFRASPGLPPGRYYLTINTTRNGLVESTTVVGANQLQYAIKYVYTGSDAPGGYWSGKAGTQDILADIAAFTPDFLNPADPYVVNPDLRKNDLDDYFNGCWLTVEEKHIGKDPGTETLPTGYVFLPDEFDPPAGYQGYKAGPVPVGTLTTDAAAKACPVIIPEPDSEIDLFVAFRMHPQFNALNDGLDNDFDTFADDGGSFAFGTPDILNGLDDDKDGWVDDTPFDAHGAAEPDYFGNPGPFPPNGLDDDGDGVPDDAPWHPAGSPEYVDDDRDGELDDTPFDRHGTPEAPGFENDWLDNDGDGFVDDIGAFTPWDFPEGDVTDQIDNDLDGYVDDGPGHPAAEPEIEEIAINFFDFSQEPDHEWVEIVSISDEEMDLTGWKLEVGYGPDDPHRTTLMVPEDTKIAPRGMLLLGVNKFDEHDNDGSNFQWPLFYRHVVPSGDPLNLVYNNGIGLANGPGCPYADVTVPPIPTKYDPYYPGDYGQSVFAPNSVDFVDYDGDSQADPDEPMGDNAQVQSTTEDFYGSEEPDAPWDRIVELWDVGSKLDVRNVDDLARLVLGGGVFPNYPEHDGIDNDGDNFERDGVRKCLLLADGVDNDGDNDLLCADGVDNDGDNDLLCADGVDNDGDGEVDEPGEGIDEPGEGIDEPGEGIDEGRYRADYADTIDVESGLILVDPGGFSYYPIDPINDNILGSPTDPPDWKEFVERRFYPGDNVVVTLYDEKDRIVDRVTYGEHDVINRAIDDVVPCPYYQEKDGQPGFSDDSESCCLDFRYDRFWPHNTMAVDFYRSLERKQPLYDGDRFGTANRWEATDGNYDDWAPSMGWWAYRLMFDSQGQPYVAGDAIQRRRLPHIECFAHAFSGSPLRKNFAQRMMEGTAPFEANAALEDGTNYEKQVRWGFDEAALSDAQYRNVSDVGDVPFFQDAQRLSFFSAQDAEALNSFVPLIDCSPTSALLKQIEKPIPYLDQEESGVPPNDIGALLASRAVAMSSLVLTCGQATFTALLPDGLLPPVGADAANKRNRIAALLDWQEDPFTPPELWTPVVLFDLPYIDENGDVDLSLKEQLLDYGLVPYSNDEWALGWRPTLDPYYPAQGNPAEALLYLLDGDNLFAHSSVFPAALTGANRAYFASRWPIEQRTVMYVSARGEHPERADPDVRRSWRYPGAYFEWGPEDGLEPGTYAAYVATCEDLDPYGVLTNGDLASLGVRPDDDLSQEASRVRDFLGKARDIREKFLDEMYVDIQFYSEPPEPLPDEDPNNMQAPDPEGRIYAGQVKVGSDRYLGMWIRNCSGYEGTAAEQGLMNQFSRVILTPVPRVPGKINVNTAETRGLSDAGQLTQLFNPLMGVPGILAYGVEDYPNDTDPISLLDTAPTDPDLEQTAPASREALFYRVHRILENRLEHDDARYYESLSDLLAPYEQDDPETRQIDEIGTFKDILTRSVAEIVGKGPEAVTSDEQVAAEEARVEEILWRYGRIANLLTTRSDVFEITVTAQAGYGADVTGGPDGRADGIINWRDPEEFLVTAEKKARTVYERPEPKN